MQYAKYVASTFILISCVAAECSPTSIDNLLSSDKRLDATIAYAKSSVSLQDAIRRLMIISGVTLRAESDVMLSKSVACSFKDLPLRDVMIALGEYGKGIWEERSGDAYILRERHDLTRWKRTMDLIAPKTDEDKQQTDYKRELLDSYNALPLRIKDALRPNNGSGGNVLLSTLPRRMQNAVLGLMNGMTLKSGEHIDTSHVNGISITCAITERNAISTINVNFRTNTIGMNIPFMINTGPEPVDEIERDPQKVKADREERAKLLADDARFDKSITLDIDNATIVDVLNKIHELTGVGFVTENVEVRPDMKPVHIQNMLLRHALDELAKSMDFEWTRTREGILIVHGDGDHDPKLKARAQSMKKLTEYLSGLSQDEKNALAGEPGVKYGALSPDLQRQINDLLGMVNVNSGVGINLNNSNIRLFNTTDANGNSTLTLGISSPAGQNSGVNLMIKMGSSM